MAASCGRLTMLLHLEADPVLQEAELQVLLARVLRAGAEVRPVVEGASPPQQAAGVLEDVLQQHRASLVVRAHHDGRVVVAAQVRGGPLVVRPPQEDGDEEEQAQKTIAHREHSALSARCAPLQPGTERGDDRIYPAGANAVFKFLHRVHFVNLLCAL